MVDREWLACFLNSAARMTSASDSRYENARRKLQSVQFKSKDGLDLSADQGGPPTATPVILLHGGGQTRFSWSRAAGELIDSGYQVLSPDLRGHGESQWSPDCRYDLDNYIGDLAVLMESLPLKPVLVGASLGGVISLTGIGERQLPQALALVLVDVVPRLETTGVQEVIDFMSANLSLANSHFKLLLAAEIDLDNVFSIGSCGYR
jgi:non-heme chloroperoxidase